MEGNDFIPFALTRTTSRLDVSGVISTGTDDRQQTEQLFVLPTRITDFPAPWLQFSEQLASSSDTSSSSSSFVRLHNEILTFCEFISPTQAELAARTRVFQDVKKVVKVLWPCAKVHVFGSQLTRILTPTSDLDLAVVGVPVPILPIRTTTTTSGYQNSSNSNIRNGNSNNNDISEYEIAASRCVSELYDLDQAIRQNKLAAYCEVIPNAKVPILKYDDKKSGISVDICVNNDSGLGTGKLIRQFVREYPPLRPLVMVLKVFLVSILCMYIIVYCFMVMVGYCSMLSLNVLMLYYI